MKNKRKINVFLLFIICGNIAGVAFFSVGIYLDLITNGQGMAFYAALPLPVAAAPASPPEDEQEYEDGLWPVLDFCELSMTCPDAVAWIYIEGASVNYPIMQWSDNYYYLHHLPDGTKNKIGAIFLDYRNSADFSDQTTLIYGHYTKSGAMFGSLKEYYSDSFYKAHPKAYISTPTQQFMVELFAGYVIDSAVETLPLGFVSDEAFEDDVKEIKERSIFQSDVPVSTDDRLVSLCTCDYSIPNGRLILVGRLIEKNQPMTEPMTD